jgi:hypothetical protein
MSENIERLLNKLQKEWGVVFVEYAGREYVVRNTTDEGLPTRKERKTVRASTLQEALLKALEEESGSHG